MELFIVRHAIAEDRRPGGEDDTRALSGIGRRRFKTCVRGMRRLGVRIDRLYHSPLLRAVQTADLMAKLVRDETVVTPLLARAPGSELLEALQGERVAVVGHEPWMSELVQLLLVGIDGPRISMAFDKGGMAWLRGEAAPGGMALLGYYDSRALRTMGRRKK